MTNTLSFNPLFVRPVGRRALDGLLSDWLEAAEPTRGATVPYNVEKHGEDRYVIAVQATGCEQKHLNITLQNGALTIEGTPEHAAQEGVEYLTHGLHAHPFELRFRLGEHIKVEEAALNHGILRIELRREVPEDAKPRMIPIR